MRKLCWAGAGALLLVALPLPSDAIAEALARRFRTVADHPETYRWGLRSIRLALAVNALLLAALPWMLRRCRTDEREPASRPERWAAAALYAISFASILPVLNSSFQQDEYVSLLEYTRHGPLVILTRHQGDAHPFYNLLAWPFVKAFGLREAALRMPALLLAPLAPAFLFLILRRWHGLWTALAGAVPLAVSVALISWGSQGRAYGPLISMVLILAWAHPLVLRGPTWGLFAYGLFAAAAVHLHLVAGFTVFALSIAAFLRPENRRGAAAARNVCSFLLATAFATLLLSPLLPQIAFESRRMTEAPPAEAFTIHGRAAELFVGNAPAAWAIPFAFAFLFAFYRRREIGPTVLAAAVSFAILAAWMTVAGRESPSRYYVTVAALLWIPIGHGVAAVFRCRPGGIITLLALLVSSAAVDARFYRLGRLDSRRAAAELRARAKPEETIGLFSLARPVQAYASPPPPVLKEPEILARPPDWLVIADIDLLLHPRLAGLLERSYRLEFTLPASEAVFFGYRLTSSR